MYRQVILIDVDLFSFAFVIRINSNIMNKKHIY